MKLSIDRSDFADAVAFVARMSPRRPLQPVLAGVLLTAEADVLKLTVYDYETAADTSIVASVVDSGVALVHAATLAQVVAKLPSLPVTLEIADTVLKITCGGVRASLPLMQAETYPAPPLDGVTVATLSGAVFEDAVVRVAIAASTNPAVPQYMGVHVVVSDGEVVFEATDRYRIAIFPVTCETTQSLQFTASAVVMREAAKAFGPSEVVEIIVGETGTVSIRGDRGTMLARTIEGNFPPLARLFPTEPKARAIVDRDVAADATGRAALAIEPKGAVRYSFDEGECSVMGKSGANGKGVSEEFDVETDAAGLTVALEPQLVLDALNSCRAAVMQMWFTHEPSATKPGPVMFTAGDGYRYLLQPNVLLK